MSGELFNSARKSGSVSMRFHWGSNPARRSSASSISASSGLSSTIRICNGFFMFHFEAGGSLSSIQYIPNSCTAAAKPSKFTGLTM